MPAIRAPSLRTPTASTPCRTSNVPSSSSFDRVAPGSVDQGWIPDAARVCGVIDEGSRRG
jgi:hypothetical protein